MKRLIILTALLLFLIPSVVYGAEVEEKGKKEQKIQTYMDKINATYGDTDIVLGGTAQTLLKYYSSNSKVATVSQVGIVTINGVGKAEITLYAPGTSEYRSAKKVVPVRVVKATPEVKAYGTAIMVGETFNLNATTTSGTKLTYSCSDKHIAKVSKKGEVTGLEPGTVTITVKSKKNKNYKEGSTDVTVTIYP